MNIAIIPARGGSKRIKNKNIKDFNGEPIISYTIKAALKSEIFDKVIVSTDDIKIKRIAEYYGAEIPFLRPSNLSNDFTTIREVIAHAITWLNKRNINSKSVCCLYATAPLIKIDDLRKAFSLFKKGNKSFIFSATKYSYPIQRSFRKNKNGKIEMLQPEHVNTRSQDLEEVYHDAGQFYFGDSDAWIKDKNPLQSDSDFVCLPTWRVQDIDSTEDWRRAEKIYETFFLKKDK